MIKKNKLLDESLSLGVVTEKEYKLKKDEIAQKKDKIKRKLQEEKERKQKRDKLRAQLTQLDELLNIGILNHEEYKNRLNELKKQLSENENV